MGKLLFLYIDLVMKQTTLLNFLLVFNDVCIDFSKSALPKIKLSMNKDNYYFFFVICRAISCIFYIMHWLEFPVKC